MWDLMGEYQPSGDMPLERLAIPAPSLRPPLPPFPSPSLFSTALFPLLHSDEARAKQDQTTMNGRV